MQLRRSTRSIPVDPLTLIDSNSVHTSSAFNPMNSLDVPSSAHKYKAVLIPALLSLAPNLDHSI